MGDYSEWNPEGRPLKAAGYLLGCLFTGATFGAGLWKLAELVGIL